MNRLAVVAIAFGFTWWVNCATRAEDGLSTYRTPPAVLVEVVKRYMANDVDVTDSLLSFDRKQILLRHSPPYVSLAEHSEPRWRGNNETVSILLNERSSFFHRHGATSLSIVNVTDGREIGVGLPDGVRIRYEQWSPDSRWLACVVFRNGPGEVWLVDARDGHARALTGPIMNSIGAIPLRWADNVHVLVTLIPQDIGSPPQPPAVPAGPDVQESDANASTGGGFFSVQPAPAGDYEKRRFAYYSTSELGEVSLDGSVSRLGVRGTNLSAQASPDGRYILVHSSLPPLVINDMYDTFPFRAAVYDRKGGLVQRVAARTKVEGGGVMNPGSVPTGRRRVAWRPDAPASLIWLEAQDGGDFDRPAPVRDELFEWRAPFKQAPVPVFKSDSRVLSVMWMNAHAAIVEDSNPNPIRVCLRRFDPSRPGARDTTVLDLDANSSWLSLYPILGRTFVFEQHASIDATSSPLGNRLQLSADGGRMYTKSNRGTDPQVFDFAQRQETPLFKGESTDARFVAFLDNAHNRVLTVQVRDQRAPNFYIVD